MSSSDFNDTLSPAELHLVAELFAQGKKAPDVAAVINECRKPFSVDAMSVLSSTYEGLFVSADSDAAIANREFIRTYSI
jgi:hypothetical protein